MKVIQISLRDYCGIHEMEYRRIRVTKRRLNIDCLLNESHQLEPDKFKCIDAVQKWNKLVEQDGILESDWSDGLHGLLIWAVT